MEDKFIDTNVFLRYLTKDDLSKYERCREMFKKALKGEITISTSGMVIAKIKSERGVTTDNKNLLDIL